MRPIDTEPSEGSVKLHSAIHGDGAYEEFKRIASEFYENHTYKFVALTLDGEPRPDIVTFTAEFWRVPDGAKDPPPSAPLTLEELREMNGEPVWVVELNGYPPRWGLVYWYRKNKRDIVYVTINNGVSIDAKTFLAAGGKIYRRKSEGG